LAGFWHKPHDVEFLFGRCAVKSNRIKAFVFVLAMVLAMGVPFALAGTTHGEPPMVEMQYGQATILGNPDIESGRVVLIDREVETVSPFVAKTDFVPVNQLIPNAQTVNEVAYDLAISGELVNRNDEPVNVMILLKYLVPSQDPSIDLEERGLSLGRIAIPAKGQVTLHEKMAMASGIEDAWDESIGFTNFCKMTKAIALEFRTATESGFPADVPIFLDDIALNTVPILRADRQFTRTNVEKIADSVFRVDWVALAGNIENSGDSPMRFAITVDQGNELVTVLDEMINPGDTLSVRSELSDQALEYLEKALYNALSDGKTLSINTFFQSSDGIQARAGVLVLRADVVLFQQIP
jgi:hypothetical protein